jgi:hypothetical protein
MQTRQLEQDCQERTAKTLQPGQNRRDWQTRRERPGQDSQKRTAKTEQPG